MSPPTDITAFTSLPSSTARINYLEKILEQLSGTEWRHLHGLLSIRHFRIDIVGNVPPELVIAIFSHLDIGTVLACQRVCRRWKALLSSVEVLKPFVEGFYTANDPSLAGEEGLDRRSACMLRVRHMTAFTKGFAYDSAFVHGTLTGITGEKRMLAVYGD